MKRGGEETEGDTGIVAPTWFASCRVRKSHYQAWANLWYKYIFSAFVYI